jgi:hypothetical protein
MSGGVIKRQRIAPDAEPRVIGSRPAPARGGSARPADAGDEPQVRVVRQGDLVESIDVTCTCGRQIVLECLYDAGEDAPGAAAAPDTENPR